MTGRPRNLLLAEYTPTTGSMGEKEAERVRRLEERRAAALGETSEIRANGDFSDHLPGLSIETGMAQ